VDLLRQVHFNFHVDFQELERCEVDQVKFLLTLIAKNKENQPRENIEPSGRVHFVHFGSAEDEKK
jgi:hypothetical protein